MSVSYQTAPDADPPVFISTDRRERLRNIHLDYWPDDVPGIEAADSTRDLTTDKKNVKFRPSKGFSAHPCFEILYNATGCIFLVMGLASLAGVILLVSSGGWGSGTSTSTIVLCISGLTLAVTTVVHCLVSLLKRCCM